MKIFKSLTTAMACALMMVAGAGAAQAQTIDTQFKDPASNSFTVDNLRSIECVSLTQYKLTHTAESFGLTYTDAGGATCAKMTNSAFVQKYFIQVPGTNRYLNSLQARRVYMDGTQTKIIWNAGPEEYFPGNAVHNAFLGRSN